MSYSSLWVSGWSRQLKYIPCSKKILREFYFADWRVFVVCGNKFLRFEMTKIFAGNLFLRCSAQAAEHLSGRNLNMFNFHCMVCWVTVHSTYILETYHGNTLLRKGTERQQNKKPTWPTMHNQTLYYFTRKQYECLNYRRWNVSRHTEGLSSERCSKYTTLRPNWERPAKMQNFALM